MYDIVQLTYRGAVYDTIVPCNTTSLRVRHRREVHYAIVRVLRTSSLTNVVEVQLVWGVGRRTIRSVNSKQRYRQHRRDANSYQRQHEATEYNNQQFFH